MNKLDYLKLAKELTGLCDIAELIKSAEKLQSYMTSAQDYSPLTIEDDLDFAKEQLREANKDGQWKCLDNLPAPNEGDDDMDVIKKLAEKITGEDLTIREKPEYLYDRETAFCPIESEDLSWSDRRKIYQAREAEWYKDMRAQIENNEDLNRPLITVYKNGWEKSPINEYQEQYFNFVDKHKVSIIKTDRQIGSTTANIYAAIKFAMTKKDSSVYYFCNKYANLKQIRDVMENSGDSVQISALFEMDNGVLAIHFVNGSSIYVTTCKNPDHLFISPDAPHQRLMLIVEDMAFIPRSLEASYLEWINFAIKTNASVILQSDFSADGKGLFNNIWNNTLTRPFNEIIDAAISKLELTRKTENIA